LTPPSEDSSPSPPHDGPNHEPSSEDSSGGGGNGGSSTSTPTKTAATDSALKRKASGVDMQGDGPSQKSQHTCRLIPHSAQCDLMSVSSVSNDKKGASTSTTGSRKKSTGTVVVS
jgi:hypothetical protein